jgi:hypothetical protein
MKIKVLLSVIAILAIIIAGALPVLAVPNNPDAITFGSVASNYQAFYNVHETGDMLFMAESYIHWVGANTPPAASNIAYIFELLSTDDLTVYASIPVWAYEDKPVSIYLTKAQVDVIGGGLTHGTAYGLRLTGSPLIYSPPTEGTNMRTVHLSSGGNGGWSNQSLDSAGLMSPLHAFGITVMTAIQTHDAVTTYLIPVESTIYITTVGGNIMLGGVIGLDSWCPQLFQFSVSSISVETPSSSGAYANSLSPLGQMGSNVDNGLKSFGVFLGLGTNGVMAGGIIYLMLALGAIVWMATKIQSPLVLPIGAVGLITIGAFLGFIPLALLFMVIALIAILTAIYFFSRGFWT